MRSILLLTFLFILIFSTSCIYQQAEGEGFSTNSAPSEDARNPSIEDGIATDDAPDESPNESDLTTINSEPGSGFHVLDGRLFLLRIAGFSWLLNNSGTAESELAVVSQAGFLPFWVRDPFTGDPVEILRDNAPIGTQIAYINIPGSGWDLSYMGSGSIGEPNAEPVYFESSQQLVERYWTWTNMRIDDSNFAGQVSEDDWDVLIWSLVESCQWIMDTYLLEHGTLPTTIDELLDDKYFINEDFITRVKELIEDDRYAPFELGVLPDRGMMYFEYSRRNALDASYAWKFDMSKGFYDLSDRDRKLAYSIPESGLRITLLSTDMFTNPDDWLSPDDRVALSQFYNTDQ